MNNIYMAGPSITQLEIDMVADAMHHWYEDPYYYCEALQNEFAEYHDRKFGIMTPNCTTSIHLLLAGLGIGPGDEVIVPECTWIASCAPVKYLGAKIVFCDIDPITWCISVKSVLQNMTKATKAVIAVDLFGNMPDMDELRKVTEENNVFLIEDAAEAVGSVYKGTKAGKFGIGSTFSFHRTKTITTGEGGMLLLDDKKLFDRCMLLRDHGRGPDTRPYYNEEVTFKYMPFNVQAAIGYAQFKRIEQLVGIKRWILEQYRKHLIDIPELQLNEEPAGGRNGAWITGLIFGHTLNMTKQKAIEELAKLGIPARPFFYPLSSIPAFNQEKEYKAKNPVAYDVSSRGINLPGAMNLTEDQIVAVCNGIRKIINIDKG